MSQFASFVIGFIYCIIKKKINSIKIYYIVLITFSLLYFLTFIFLITVFGHFK
jgi:hypothetical protein